MKIRIQLLALVVSIGTGTISPLRAQVVNDGETRTLSNVTTNITGDVVVGTNGSFTRLVLSNNALLTNSTHGVIGRDATARSNAVHLVSPSARWLMGGTLFVGSNGPSSTLVVSNGAFVRANAGILGRQSSSGSNLVLVTGAGSMWSNVAGVTGVGLTVGSQGSGNQLIVSNGGWVVNAGGSGSIGSNSSNNVARVTGPGSVWSNVFALNLRSIGAGNGNNRLVVEDGGQVFNDDGAIDGLNGGGNNSAFVTGSGAVWNNSRDLYVGSSARGTLVVSNGGTVLSANGYVGQNSNQVLITGSGSRWNNGNDVVLHRGNTLTAIHGGWLINSNGYLGGFTPGALSSSNNTVAVTGAGSTWSNQADLFVGFAGPRNQLVVSNGAIVAANNLFIGFHPDSLGNRVTVDGGTLRVTNAAGTGALAARRGTNVLNAGLVEVDRLVVTNTAGKFELNGGTLYVKNAVVAHQQLFRVGNGVNPANFTLVGNSTHTFVNGLSISANAVLAGSGTIGNTVTVLSGGTFAPGAPIGKVVLFNPPSLQGVVRMEISKNGAVLTNDQIQVMGALNYGGSLTVSNVGPAPLTAGDRFQLFPAGSYAGSFSSVTLPPLGVGVRWKNQLLVDGSIEVESFAPSVQTLPASALTQTSATFNGVANPKGTSTTAWFEFGFTTNYGFVTPPQAVGSVDANANFSEMLTTLIPGFGYHFRAVASNAFGVGFGADQGTAPAQPDYLKSSDNTPLAGFGQLVALSGNTLVVAGNGVYVFEREGSLWEQQAHLTGFQFISSVAISGDTLAIGDAKDDNSGTNTDAGAAHVFVRSGTTWTRQAILRKSNPVTLEEFGRSVTISGNTIVVGVPLETHSTVPYPHDPFDPNLPTSGPGINAGTAYVFVRNGTNWSQQAFLRSDNIVLRGVFGSSVAMAGDTIVVGERNGLAPILVNGVSSFGLGPVHVFVRNGADWNHQATLLSGNPGFGVEEGGGFAFGLDEFGASIAISDDTIVVGSPREDSNATGVNGSEVNDLAVNSGAAYVFVRSGTTWTRQAYLKASNTGSNDFFGASVAVSGDRIIIGAAGEDSNARNVDGDGANNLAPGAGAAYVFARQGATWSFRNFLKASNTESNDAFGVSVAASADLLVVGASGEDSNDVGLNGDQDDNSATNSGAVYIFGPARLPAPEITVSHSGTNLFSGARLPQEIAAVGNTATRSVTIKNSGREFLTGLGIAFDGADAAMFSVAVPPVAPLTPTSNTTFIVRFAPTSGGTKTATLHIASNDENENPFDLQLNDLALSFTEDRDGDGLNDASELLMESFGFNFQVSQPSLVSTLFNNVGGAVSNLNGVGFFRESQLQALNVNTPLLAKDPFSGLFKLTIGVEKATDLTNFFPFPMTTSQTIINAEGKLEFEFSSPDNAAYFRLEAR